MAILHGKHGLLCDKMNCLSNPEKAKQTLERLNFETLYFFNVYTRQIFLKSHDLWQMLDQWGPQKLIFTILWSNMSAK